MPRGAKPAKARVQVKSPAARKSPRSEGSRLGDLEKRLAEALEREAATSEILRVMSRWPSELQPVLDAVAERAACLCEALDASILMLDGDVLRFHANHGSLPQAREPIPLRGTLSGRAVLEGRTVHVQDVQAAADEFPVAQARALRQGGRSGLAAPLVRGGVPIGAILIRRGEVRPFSDQHVALLQTFANQAVIAIENVRLFKELEERNAALTESLDQQTATADILGVISSSPTDMGPVFSTILASATRLCEASFAVLFLYDGEALRVAAHQNASPQLIRHYESGTRVMPSMQGPARRAALLRETVHIADMTAEPGLVPIVLTEEDVRTVLAVPLLREGALAGVIAMWRREVRPFTDKQVALVRTFADQAVIAIENVRLFTELEARNRDLTATSEILRVISSSPTDVQPVFDAIVDSAATLCDAVFSVLSSFDGHRMDIVAAHNWSTAAWTAARRTLPGPPSRALVTGRAILERAVVHVPDVALDPEFDSADLSRRVGFRSVLAVPMLSDGMPVGAIGVGRAEPGPFSDNQIALLKTFADQAIIAVQNVRLFHELQTRNRDLTEALEQQTATSDVLRVISRSQTDVQPVFDALIDSARKLCAADIGAITRLDGEVLRLALHSGMSAAVRGFWEEHPVPLSRTSVTGRAAVEQRTMHVPDILADPSYGDVTDPVWRDGQTITEYRAAIVVPMLRDGALIGTIGVFRSEPHPFAASQIKLLETFADQAVIAIENVRLFKELQARTAELTRSVEELTALGDVGRALSSTLNLEAVLQTIVARATQLTEMAGCVIWEYDKPRAEFRLRVSHYADNADASILPAPGGVTTILRGQGLTTQVMEGRRAVQIPDITVEGAYESTVRKSLIDAGHRALLGVPLLSEDEVIGVLAITRKTPGLFEPETVRLLSTFATQSALAIQNARLFHEIEDKSRQLEAASQHKSEFLANMSHELRTPLNAIIGFSEVLSERMFGELNEKQEEYLRDIHASGQHLLSLINDILDLSKIEAGRMELELTDFDLPTAIDNAMTLVRERAGRRGIALHKSVDQRLGQIRGDERKIKQVLLNLLSNALKFTPEGGRVGVRATVSDGMAEVSVTDTGIGIAPEDQEAVFEEFRQVGTADKKVEGTGLGLTLSRKFIELHGGRIWLKSQVGLGSTFMFTVPVRDGE